MTLLILAGIALAGLALLAVGYFVWIVKLSGSPTRGEKIDLAARPNSALLVIDVQEDFTRNSPRPYPQADRDRAIERINQDIRAAEAAGHDVILIKQVFRHWPAIWAMKLLMGGIGTPGRKGLVFDRDLQAGEAPVFEKPIGDAFFNPDLEAYLAERKVGQLFLTGLDACQCVQLTARGAMNRGYAVEIIESAILTVTPEKWQSVRTALIENGAAVQTV